jgi:small membrane protein
LESQVIIQWLLVPAIIAAVLVSLRSRNSLRGQARRKIIAVVTLVAGVVAVINPSILQAIADFVGIARGVDLILYGLALVIIYLVGSVSVRFREHEAKVVLLSRALALLEAERRLPQPAAAPAAVTPYVVGVDAA